MRLIEHVHSHPQFKLCLAGLNVKMFEYYEYLNVSAVKFVSSHVNFIQFNDACNMNTLRISHPPSYPSRYLMAKWLKHTVLLMKLKSMSFGVQNGFEIWSNENDDDDQQKEK